MSGEAPIKALGRLLGDQGVLTAPHDMAPYLSDALGLFHGEALCVARPRHTEEVAETLRIAARHGLSVTPAGGRTGFCGGAVPGAQNPHIVVSLERMRRIRAIDTVNDALIADAGCTLAEIREAADRADRLFPVSHGGEGSSQIGGMIATNAGGNNVLRYGMARTNVLGLEVVLADGTIWDGLRTLRKDNSGYDLKQLFIGSEGTLGIVTGAALALRPRPLARGTALAAVAGPEAALDLYAHMCGEIGELISAFELMPKIGVDLHLARRGGGSDPFAGAHPWMVLVELETVIRRLDPADLLEETLAAAFEKGLAHDAVVARSEDQRRRLWALREGLAEAQVANPCALKSDTSVPVGATAEFVRRAGEAVEAVLPGAVPVPFGHVGDGNIHFNVLAPDGMGPAEFAAVAPRLAGAIRDVALSCGGSIAAEHGLGQAKRDAAAACKPPVEIEMMRRIRRALDPAGRMNPGKIVDT